MSNSVKRYRIYAREEEVAHLPDDVTVEESYPAFSIVSASEDAMAELRGQYPVEGLQAPKPPPAIPETAAMAADVVEPEQRGPYTRAVRFRAPVRPEWMAQLQEIGCQTCGTIGSSTVVVRCPNKTVLAKLEKLPTIERITRYVLQINISEQFFETLDVDAGAAEIAAAARNLDMSAEEPQPGRGLPVPGMLVASFFTHDDQQLALRRLPRAGVSAIESISDTDLIIDLEASKDPIEAFLTIAERQGLRSLQEKTVESLSNDLARNTIADLAVAEPPEGLGLTGAGEIVAVSDSGLDTGDLDTLHLDFRGRVRDIWSLPLSFTWRRRVLDPNSDDGAADIYSGHGTHVCGSIMGNGARARVLELDQQVMGTAPEAELVFQAIDQTANWNQRGKLYWLTVARHPAPAHGLYGIPENIQVLFERAYEQGARIHSNSWGGGAYGGYNNHSRNVDQFVWDHEDYLVIVAAGNEGNNTNPIGAPGSVLSPGTAKNCLTVGACQNDRFDGSRDQLAEFSGRGPCLTGRRKPDVIAPGTFVLSTRSRQISSFGWRRFEDAAQDYMYNGGTSMATPLVAGCAALVREHLRNTPIGSDPSAALVKAVLIHSAQYHESAGPHPTSAPWADNEQGWGRVDLKTVLRPEAPSQVLFFDETDGLTTGQERVFTIQVTDSDAPLRMTLVYTDFPGEDLINNLNLFTNDPNGVFSVGNDFTNAGAPDGDNNVEGVVIPDPAIGTWSVRVVASNVPEGPQDFALVVSGDGVQSV